MTGPNDPFDSDGFPEVVPAGPASTELPPEPEQAVYDTGSDAWWRAQAAAQRAAAEQEAPAPAPVPDTPEVPVATPLDPGWLPADLPVAASPELDAEPEPAPAPAPAPEPEPIWAPTPAEASVEAAPDTSYADDVARERPAPPSTPVGPRQAVAGAAVAVLGVALAVGALFVFNHHEDTGSPAVVVPTQALTTQPPMATRTLPPATPAPVGRPTTAPSAVATPTSAPPPAAPVAAPVVPVSVLNNSKISGLAKRAAADFRAGGWPVPVEGNYRGGTIRTTTVYYALGQKASAMRFAQQFGIPRVAPRFAGLPTKGMTVVVTRDYRAS